MRQTLVTVCRDEVALRFDTAAEAILLSQPDRPGTEPEIKHLVLAHASSEDLCDLILRMGVRLVVCGAVEEDYCRYLKWKRVEMISDVSGPLDTVLARLAAGELRTGDMLHPRLEEQP